jgi:uncharacterized protein HemX
MATGSRKTGLKLTSEARLHELTRLRLAIGFAFVYLGMIFIMLVYVKTGIGDAEQMAAVLTGVMGAALGFLFGSQQTDRAQAEADVEKQLRKASEFESENVDMMTETIKSYEEVADQLEAVMGWLEEQDPALTDSLASHLANLP